MAQERIKQRDEHPLWGANRVAEKVKEIEDAARAKVNSRLRQQRVTTRTDKSLAVGLRLLFKEAVEDELFKSLDDMLVNDKKFGLSVFQEIQKSGIQTYFAKVADQLAPVAGGVIAAPQSVPSSQVQAPKTRLFNRLSPGVGSSTEGGLEHMPTISKAQRARLAATLALPALG